MITYSCPNCKQSLQIHDQYVGKSGRCKACGHTFTVPMQNAIDQPDFEIVKKKLTTRRGLVLGGLLMIAPLLFFAGTFFSVSTGGSSSVNEPGLAFMGDMGEASPSSPVSNDRAWHEGGTLHNATIAQWKVASARDKLATCADWLSETKWKGQLNSPEDFDGLKIESIVLVNSINNFKDFDSSVDFLSASDIVHKIISETTEPRIDLSASAKPADNAPSRPDESKPEWWLRLTDLSASVESRTEVGKRTATLGDANFDEWKVSPEDNKIATCAMLLLPMCWNGHLNAEADFDRWYDAAVKLAREIDVLAEIGGSEKSPIEMGALMAGLQRYKYCPDGDDVLGDLNRTLTRLNRERMNR